MARQGTRVKDLERDLESLLIGYIEARGGFTRKLLPDGNRGNPDRYFAMPGGHSGFIELKRPDGTNRASLHQAQTILELLNLGVSVYICDNFTACRAALGDLGDKEKDKIGADTRHTVSKMLA